MRSPEDPLDPAPSGGLGGADLGGALEIRDNAEESRFEIFFEGRRVGLAQYRLQPGRMSLIHTETDADVAGRGIASHLIRYALDGCRTQGTAVYPYCPFVRGYIEKHREYLDLVPPDVRGRFGLG